MISIINNVSVAVGFKRRGWCWFYHCTECGMTVVQIGPVIVEMCH